MKEVRENIRTSYIAFLFVKMEKKRNKTKHILRALIAGENLGKLYENSRPRLDFQWSALEFSRTLASVFTRP